WPARPVPADVAAPLGASDTARLTDFARACKAAARAVVLYPGGHPAIAATLGRIAHITSAAAQSGSLTITVLPDGLLLDDRPPARADAAITELATLLHSHLIGQLTVHAGGDVEAWRAFLVLLGRSAEAVRADGGISRVWTTMAGRHVELREIDYAEVLRERSGGDRAIWNRVIANCLQGSAFELDESGIRELLGIAGDSDQLVELMTTIEASAGASGGVGTKTAALMRMLRGIVDVVSKNDPERLESVWNHVAEELLTSYSDEPFVSDAYGNELSGARMQAVEVEHVSDDPPERIGAWLRTIATTALRALDLALVLDLLRIEQEED